VAPALLRLAGMRFGYKLMTEEHGPLALVENARRAEAAGFDFVAASDHFHPWLRSQGHSPFAWSVLGAIATATSRVDLVTAVTCPFIRYHPAIVAQAAATVACLAGGRMALGIGAGEELNEHVVGRGWPPSRDRLEMLVESIEIIRRLWRGGAQTWHGRHLRIDRAELFDRPDRPPPIVVAAAGPRGAGIAGKHGDGLFATEPKRALVDAWRRAGGTGAAYAEVALSWAADRDTAVRTAHDRFRFGLLGWKVMSDLPHPENFEAATRLVRPEDVARAIPCGPDPEPHLAAIHRFRDAGFDHLVLIGVGPDQEGFLRFWRDGLAPRLR
jgi:G6PDH family F420-dependent oxidoreductase